jgi:hypothetical protein
MKPYQQHSAPAPAHTVVLALDQHSSCRSSRTGSCCLIWTGLCWQIKLLSLLLPLLQLLDLGLLLLVQQHQQSVT